MSTIETSTASNVYDLRNLRDQKVWLTWKYVPVAGKKPRKVPYYASGKVRKGQQGRAEELAELVAFAEAKAAVNDHGHDGTGVAVLAKSGLVWLDFDHCVVDGVIDPAVAQLVSGTYNEFSPSGTGIRAVMAGSLPDDKDAHPVDGSFGFEVFHAKGFVTITGNTTPLYTSDGAVCGITPEVLELYEARFGISKAAKAASAPSELGRALALRSITDDTIVELRSALDGLADYRSAERDNWVKVGQALKSVEQAGFPAEARDMWHEFSSRCKEKYSVEDADATWASFTPRAVSHRSIFAMAAEDGWKNPRRRDPAVTDGRPAYAGVTQTGRVPATVTNVHLALQQPTECGIRIGYDDFNGAVFVGAPDDMSWRPITDEDTWSIRRQLDGACNFLPVSKDLVRDAVNAVARENTFDSAIEWLDSLEWDGKSRVSLFANTHLKTPLSTYTEAWSLYLWTALAGRVLKPGIKADMVPVLVSDEGRLKSSLVAALAPHEGAFAELDMKAKDDDISRLMKGKVVLEWSELKGLDGRDEESIKGFITQRVQRWIPKYREHEECYPRRGMIIGTTNNQHILPTYGEARRWLPLQIDQLIDVKTVMRDRDQLWAEAAMLFKRYGIMFEDVERLARDERDAFRQDDPAAHAVLEWLNEKAVDDDGYPMPGKTHADVPFTFGELTQRLSARSIKFTNDRISKLLNQLGFVSEQPRSRRDRMRGGRRWVKQ
jgi:hypothetical protein